MKKIISCVLILILTGCTSTSGNEKVKSVDFEVNETTIDAVVKELGKPTLRQIVNDQTWLTYSFSKASGFIAVDLESTTRTYQFDSKGLLIGVSEYNLETLTE